MRKSCKIFMTLFLAVAFVAFASARPARHAAANVRFENHSENVSPESPDGVPCELNVSLSVPVGNGAVQRNIAKGLCEIIKNSELIAEMPDQGVPSIENYLPERLAKEFEKGIRSGKIQLDGPLSFNLMIDYKSQDSEAVYFNVVDRIFGNGSAPTRVKAVSKSTGRVTDTPVRKARR